MAHTNGTSDAAHRVLVLGDNLTSISIAKALSVTRYAVHTTTRSSSSSEPGYSHITAKHVHQCDLSAESLREVLARVKPDVLVSAAAGGSLETQERIISTAIECDVTRFVPNEFGADSLNPAIQQRLPPSAEKAKVIKHLELLAGRGEVSWVGLATGTILDRGLLTGDLGFDLKWQSATLHGTGKEQFAASSAAWVGRVVAAALKHWDQVRNRYLYVAGLMTSANEVVDALQDATGKEWMVGRADVDECVREAERRVERGYPDAGMFLMQRTLLYDESINAVRPFVVNDEKGLLGLESEKLEDIVHHVVHEHQHHGGKGGCGCD